MSVDRRQVLGLLGGGLAAGLVATPAAPARADAALDRQILQTASSLEVLAEEACARITAGPLAGFAHDANRRHAGQRQALQARTAALGGRIQEAANPTFQARLAGADPVAAATTVEQVLVNTYLGNLAMLDDRQAKELLAAAMAVAAQHLAVLRMAAAGAELFRLPFRPADMARLPATAASGATPDALHQVGGPDLVADPASGAVG